MKQVNVWHGLGSLNEANFAQRGTVTTIGVFDGLHRGHQELLKQAGQRAKELGIPAVMLTFDPHPVSVFLPARAPLAICSLEQRIKLAGQLGIDDVVVIDFTKEVAGLSPFDYAQQVLKEKLNVKDVFVGENFSFGADAAGSAATLQELGMELGFNTHVVPIACDESVRISSSFVREQLETGNVARANWALGRALSFSGPIVRGAGRGGKELGFPTANQYPDENLALPADGVYAGWLRVDTLGEIAGNMSKGIWYAAAISLGTNPTFGDEHRSIESFVLDREADLYGHVATVQFVSHVRDMVKFSSIDELLLNIREDVKRTRVVLAQDLDFRAATENDPGYFKTPNGEEYFLQREG